MNVLSMVTISSLLFGLRNGQPFRMFIKWCIIDHVLSPHVRRQELVSSSQCCETCFQSVSSSFGASSTASVDILNTSHLQHLFRNRCSDNTSSSRSGNQSNSDTSSFSSDFHRNSVWSSDFVSPISFSDWHQVDFGIQNGSFDSSLHFFMYFSSQSNVSFTISYYYIDFESSSLSSSGLFLDWFDLHDFFLQDIFQEIGDNFRLFDRNGESEDFFKTSDFLAYYQSSQLGDWVPVVFLSELFLLWFLLVFSESSLLSLGHLLD